MIATLPHWAIGAIILLEFAVLLFLGGLLLRVIYWDNTLRQNRDHWLMQLHTRTRQLRALRRQLDKTGGEWPEIPLPPGLRQQWTALRWIGRLLQASGWVRS